MNNPPRNHHSSGNGSWLSTFGLLDQYLAPHHALTRCMQRLTRVQAPWFKDRQIQWFIRRYQVDMGIAAQSDPLAYPDFNNDFVIHTDASNTQWVQSLPRKASQLLSTVES